MRFALYILILLSITSCNSGDKNESFKNLDVLEEESTTSAFEVIPEAFNYEALAAHKLQEYFDLLLLEQRHPEFKSDIRRQLLALSSDSIGFAANTDKITIKNVQQIGASETVSDSIQLLTLSFDIETASTSTRDTLIAKIISKNVMLEDAEVPTTKLYFLNYKN
jgi:hypothetical protein